MATIKDVARRAGVSISAVSRALNNYPDINADTRARILKIAEELHYYPKASARNLATNRSHMIGVLYPDLDGTGLRHPFVSHLLNVFKDAIGERGYDMLIFSNTRQPFNDWGILDRVRHRGVDGLLLIGVPDENIDPLIDSDLPMVGLDYIVYGRRCGSVTSDNRRAVHELVLAMYESGCRDFGFVHGPLKMPVAMERLQGFYSGMASVGLTPNMDWVVGGEFTLEGGKKAMKQLLSRPEKPKALLCSADVTAIGVVQVLHETGLSIPGDLEVVGFDDIEAASYTHPALTTVRQNAAGMGRLAAELLVTLIDSPEENRTLHYVLPTELVVRSSTRALRDPANALRARTDA